MKVDYTHRIPTTCFGHSCGWLKGGALQSVYERSLKNNANIWHITFWKQYMI
jgi:hypothetical protein